MERPANKEDAAAHPARMALIPSARGIEAIKLLARLRGLLFDATGAPEGLASTDEVNIDRGNLIALGRDGGLSLVARRCAVSALASADLPAIGSVSSHAYFVIEAVTADTALIRADERHAPTLIPLQRLASGWTGMVWIPGVLDAAPRSPEHEVRDHAKRHSRAVVPIAVWVAIALVAAVVMIAVWKGVAPVATELIATGRPVPEPPPTPITAPASGVLSGLAVKDGVATKAGDAIGEIVVTVPANAEADRAEIVEVAVAVARAQALLTAIATDALPELLNVPDLDAVRRAIEQRHLVARFDEYRGKLAAINGEMEQRNVERVAAAELVARTNAALEAARSQAAESKVLFEQGFLSRNSYIERDERRLELERDLARHKKFVEERGRALEALEERRRATRAELERTLQVERDESSKLLERLRKPAPPTTRIVAVVAAGDGFVRNMEQSKTGQPIEQGEQLGVIIPPRTPLQIDLILAARDALAVKPGQLGTASGSAPMAGAPDIAVRVIAVAEHIAGAGERDRATRVRLQADLPIEAASALPRDPDAIWQIRVHTGAEMTMMQWLRRFKGR